VRLFLVFICALFLVGCGYSFRALDPSLRTIFIAPVKNQIKIETDYSSVDDIKKYYPNLEVFVRQKLIERFLVEGGLEVVDKPSADIKLNITLVEYAREPVGYDNNDSVQRWRVRIGAELKLVRRDKETSKKIYGEAVYDPAVKGERFAVNSAVEDLARRISDLVLNAW